MKKKRIHVIGYSQGNNQWTWKHFNRRLPNQNAKTKKKKKTEYPRIMGQLQEKQYKHYWNIREEIKK